LIANKFVTFNQLENKTCDPTNQSIIVKHYKRTLPLHQIRELSKTIRSESNLLNLNTKAEKLGFRSLGIKVSFGKLKRQY